MTLETDAAPTHLPSLDELIATAKEVSGAFYQCLGAGEEMPPLVLIASRRDNDQATALIPPVEDDLEAALTATRWLPGLLIHHQANACVLVMVSEWRPDEDECAPGTNLTRPQPGEKYLYLSGYGHDGDVFEFANIEQPPGAAPASGAWKKAAAPCLLEMWSNAAHAALGRYDSDAAFPAPEVDAPFAVVYDGEASLLLEAAGIAARVFNGPDGKKAVVVCEHPDSTAARDVLQAAGAEIAELRTEDRRYLLTAVAYSAPLDERGVSDEHRGPLPGELSVFFDETNQLSVPPPGRRASSRVGRNQPCTCGSGAKFKRCCGR